MNIALVVMKRNFYIKQVHEFCDFSSLFGGKNIGDYHNFLVVEKKFFMDGEHLISRLVALPSARSMCGE